MAENVRLSIKERREALGISQAELARKMGVSAPAVLYWETGKAVPNAVRLKQLSTILQCTTDDLYQEEVS